DCFLNSKDGKNCGSSRGLSGLVRLSECNDEVKQHLISCHLSKELILARTGLFHLAQEDKQKMWICYAKVTCQYPCHAGVRKRIQGRYVITLQMSQDIQKLFGDIVPVGSALCVPCRKKHKKKVDDSESWLRQEEPEKNLRSLETPLLDTRQL
ncbi:hypothetical protein P5673_011863, partial [Acropora cervicornis]